MLQRRPITATPSSTDTHVPTTPQKRKEERVEQVWMSPEPREVNLSEIVAKIKDKILGIFAQAAKTAHSRD